jgi:hypothetical protein
MLGRVGGLAMLATLATSACAHNPVPFEHVKGYPQLSPCCGAPDHSCNDPKAWDAKPQNLVFSREGDWKTFWQQHCSALPPQVDFARYQLAVVFSGFRPSGGFCVQIVTVERTWSGQTRIRAIERVPRKDELVTADLNYPADVVVFERQPGNFTFEITRTTKATKAWNRLPGGGCLCW